MKENYEISKNIFAWGLKPINYIWATLAQKTYQAIISEPWLQFSQRGSHFLQNHKMNPIKP